MGRNSEAMQQFFGDLELDEPDKPNQQEGAAPPESDEDRERRALAIEEQLSEPSLALDFDKKDGVPDEIEVEVKVLDAAQVDKKSGPETVVVIGGLGEDLHVMTPFLRDLALRGKQVVFISMPGYGESSDPKSAWRESANKEGKVESKKDFSDYSNLIAAALKKLRDNSKDFQIRPPAEKYSMVGHSLGGSIAADYAGRNPKNLKSLVLVAPAGYRKETVVSPLRIPPKITWEFILAHFGERMGRFLKGEWDGPAVVKKMWMDNALRRDVLNSFRSKTLKPRIIQRFWEASVVAQGDLFKNIDAAAGQGVKVALVAGKQDMLFPVKDYEPECQKRDHVDFEVMPGANHYSFIDKSDVYAQKITEILKENTNHKNKE